MCVDLRSLDCLLRRKEPDKFDGLCGTEDTCAVSCKFAGQHKAPDRLRQHQGPLLLCLFEGQQPVQRMHSALSVRLTTEYTGLRTTIIKFVKRWDSPHYSMPCQAFLRRAHSFITQVCEILIYPIGTEDDLHLGSERGCRSWC